MILNNPDLDHEYLPITGLLEFTESSSRLVLGSDSPAISQDRVASVQGVSGTGSLRVGAEFLAKYKPGITIYISNPTWSPHSTIFTQVGLQVKEYPYYNKSTNSIDIEGLMSTLKEASSGSCFVLHACAHNPTGLDPSNDQWKEIANIMMERNHFPFFDCAYQGFASGDLDQDAYAPRLFISLGMELFVAQSYSKNLGLYSERVGCLVTVHHSTHVARSVKSQLAKIIRPMISNPPAFGARIVALILSNSQLYQEWLSNLNEMTTRIQHMRQLLHDSLVSLNTPGTWNHLLLQKGMFGYTGLNETQSRRLREEFHIYLTDNGRISIPGLTTKNVSYVAECINIVVRDGN